VWRKFKEEGSNYSSLTANVSNTTKRGKRGKSDEKVKTIIGIGITGCCIRYPDNCLGWNP